MSSRAVSPVHSTVLTLALTHRHFQAGFYFQPILELYFQSSPAHFTQTLSHVVQEVSETSFGDLSKPAKIDDLEAGVPMASGNNLQAGMPIASGNTLVQSMGVQGLSEAEHSPRSLLDTNLPISSGADLRDKDSHVMVAGLTE